MSRSATPAQFQHKSKTLNDKYLLGDEIGKGAYGRVYMGLDSENGDFVAIKEVSLEDVFPEDLASIMQEIDLLKNLNHKNIVKYLGSFKTKSHLYIILEYVENGSLASIIKPNKFGAFPESLVAVYIAQVLEGLVYLHEQGVIHRDIKGANILTTKEGLVKLADFGVATKLTESDANTDSVVGTPYWMAPEVIKMSGLSAASDIWSMGCTVIELLTCVPPYYDLQPMTALYRIVEEEHPPIPEHISPLLTDFLLQCFRKDAKLRPDAKTLLRHPWILNSRRASYSSVAQNEGRQKNVSDDTLNDRLKLVEGESNASRGATYDTRGNNSSSYFDDNAISFRHAEEAEMSILITSSSPALVSKQLVGQSGEGKSADHKVIGSDESFAKHITENGGSRQSSVSLVPGQEVIISTKVATASIQKRAELQLAGKTSSVPLKQDLSKFSDTLANCTLDDLFDITSGRMPASKAGEDLRPSFVKTKPVFSSSDSASVDNERLKLAMELKANIVQKKVAGEGANLAKSSERNMFPTLMGCDEAIKSKIPDLVTLRTQSVELNRLVGLLKPEESEDSVIKACQKLVSIFKEQPEQKSQIIAQHGVMPFMEMFDVKNTRVVHAVMQVVYQLAKDDSRFQENACLGGLIPVVMSFAGPEHSKEMRLQAASFVQQLCQTSSWSLQMFIACRGLPVLVGFLEPDYGKYREMVHIAIDGMWQVFKLHTATPRSDFCRILAKNGVLIRLVNTLHSLNEATRLCTAVRISSGSTADNVANRSWSGPIQPSGALSGHIEAFHPRSGQLDASRVRAGSNFARNLDSFQSLSGASSKSHVVKVAVEHQTSHVESANPFPNLFEHVTTDGGWSSCGQQEQPLLFRVDRENFDLGPLESSPLEMDQRGPSLGNNVNTKHNMDQSWRFVDHVLYSNGCVESSQNQQEQIQPLISLIEKDPSSRPVSGQLDYIRHLQYGLDRHESILPLLHHACTIRKDNGESELKSAFDENGKVNGLIAQGQLKTSIKVPTSFSTMSFTQAVGSITAGENCASSIGVISQPASGQLTVSGVLNGKPVSETSSGVLSRMLSTLNADAAREYLEKVAELLLEFSHGDTVVKSHMCSLSLLIRLFQMLNKLEPPILLKVLECIKELSADPYTLEHLQRADAMKHLVPFLERREGLLVPQIRNEVMVALYNLCKINKRRQERAAESGIIPHLMHFIKIKSQLKQFALPLICDMAHASRYTREQLRANKGIELYLSLLEDEGWAVTALDSLAVCLALDNDQRKVEQTLLRAEAIHKLVAFFQSCGELTFVHILEPFLKIIIKSPRINVSLATSGFVPLLVERLDHQDAIVRLNLLKLIKAVYEHHPRPKQLIVEYDLQQKLQRLIEERRNGDRSGGQVLVKQMATSLLKALHINCVL